MLYRHSLSMSTSLPFPGVTAGQSASAGAWTVVELKNVKQRESAGAKIDLPDELAGLLQVPGIREIVEALTEPSIDDGLVEDLAAPFSGRLRRDGSITEVTLHAPASQPWPAALGGPSAPGERYRILTVAVRHAGWRD